jgi:hypothetical protein
MGASSSTTEHLSSCDHDILKYVLGRRSSHIKDIFLCFTEQQKQNKSLDPDKTPHPVMENADQFAEIFTSTKNDHSDLRTFFDVLDDRNIGAVDFYEAIATLVCHLFFSVVVAGTLPVTLFYHDAVVLLLTLFSLVPVLFSTLNISSSKRLSVATPPR